jgi:hypothetical protein
MLPPASRWDRRTRGIRHPEPMITYLYYCKPFRRVERPLCGPPQLVKHHAPFSASPRPQEGSSCLNGSI